MAIFGECLNYKSGLRILIFPPKVPFFCSQRWALLAKVTVFGPQKKALLIMLHPPKVIMDESKLGVEVSSTVGDRGECR